MNKYNEKKNIFSFNKLLRYASIILIVSIFSIGSVYALTKIFDWDNDLLKFFNFTKEETEINNFEVSNIEKTVEIDDCTIEVKQATVFNNDTYLLLNVKFKKALTTNELENWTMIHGIGLIIENKLNDGFIEITSINEEKTEAIMVVPINTDKHLKLNDDVKIKFSYDYYETSFDDGSSMGDFKQNKMLDWTVDINPLNKKIDYTFKDKIYLKDNELIKIYPTNISITPIGIYLKIRLDSSIEDLTDDKLVKFDKDIVINFNDGKQIKINSIIDEDTIVKGRNIIAYDKDENGNTFRFMNLSWESIYSRNNYSKYNLNLLDVKNIKNIIIGDKIIELEK